MRNNLGAMTLAVSLSLATEAALAATTTASLPGAPWYSGTVEQAFAAAKVERKPLLLYWGAVWCPPCNELKSQVFSKPRFSELMQPMIAAYLDGDSETAQSWGERLKVAGYPTVLVFDSSGRETMRLGTSLSMSEFETALTSALATGGTMQDALKRALAGSATRDDWRMLAYYAWDTAESNTMTPLETLTARAALPNKIPSAMKLERAVLSARLLESAATESDEKALAFATSLKAGAEAYVASMLADPETERATRSTIAYYGGEIATWGWGPKAPQRADAERRWLAAAARVSADPEASTDVRLWASAARLAWFEAKAEALAADVKITNKTKKSEPLVIPADIKQEIIAAVAEADARATTAYDRHSVISGAAALLRKVGDFDGARKLLDKELAQTDTPWYYHSSYASLERAAGNDAAALVQARKARESVKGRASKLQWIVEDLALTAKVSSKGQDERVRELARDYYETATALPDGFSGRNASRAKKVAEILKPFLKQPDMRSTIRGYAKKCVTTSCAEHFGGLLAGV